jgi:hypothetical protein
VLNFFEFNPI